jgi:hypothetical protein
LRATSLQTKTYRLDIADLPAGTYILHIKTANGREAIRKIIHE